MDELKFWEGKKALITGHTGFKGAWLCKILEASGADIVGYALEPPPGPSLFEICKPGIDSITGDVRDFDALLKAFKTVMPEIVIHMAAQPLVLESYQDPRYTYEVNAMGTVNLMECVRQCGSVRSLLNVTTDKVYLNCECAEGYREDGQLNGHDPYSNSKSCSELVTSSYDNSFFKQMGIAASTVRSGNVIGGGDFSKGRLIPDCARAAAKGDAVKIRNPESVRPYQHVLDTLFAYLLIARAQYADPSAAGAYNIGPCESGCVTNGELAAMFCEAWGGGAGWERIMDDSQHEAKTLKLNCSKIQKAMGWEPRWGIKRAAKETAMWYKAYFGGGGTNGIMAEQIAEFTRPAGGQGERGRYGTHR